jgi:hypothetical protein
MSLMLMKGVRMTQSDTAESIKGLYPTPLPDAEVQEAASNLIGFFELLIEIDREQAHKPQTTGAQA